LPDDHPFQQPAIQDNGSLVLPEIQQHINGQNSAYTNEYIQNRGAFNTVKASPATKSNTSAINNRKASKSQNGLRLANHPNAGNRSE
jgi:hypothetical protein